MRIVVKSGVAPDAGFAGPLDTGDMATTAVVTRSRDNRMIAGVCAGIARRYGWKTRNVRLAFVASCVLPGPQFLLYLVLWAVLPEA